MPSSEDVKSVTLLLAMQRILTPGKHGVHVHEVGACTPTCSAAGSHVDLGPFPSNVPVTTNHPYHSGDLPNIRVGSLGKGAMTHVTSRISVSDGRLGIFDLDGASILIKELPDTYCADPTDPLCAGGARVACGVLQRVQ